MCLLCHDKLSNSVFRLHQFRVSLAVDKLLLITSELQASQLLSDASVTQQFGEHAGLLSQMLVGQSQLQGLLSPQGTPRQRAKLFSSKAKIPTAERSPVIALRVSLPPLRCMPICECACHVVHEVQTPQSFHKLLGVIFIGYTGSPVFMQPSRSCTDARCISSLNLQAHFHYVFPIWFLERLITMRVKALHRSGLSLSLNIRGLIPSLGAKIWRLVIVEDIDGLKELFANHLATPNDAFYSDGHSILFVSYVRTSMQISQYSSPSLIVTIIILMSIAMLGLTLLRYKSAIVHNRYKVCKFLLQAGADPHLANFRSGRCVTT